MSVKHKWICRSKETIYIFAFYDCSRYQEGGEVPVMVVEVNLNVGFDEGWVNQKYHSVTYTGIFSDRSWGLYDFHIDRVGGVEWLQEGLHFVPSDEFQMVKKNFWFLF